VLSGLLLAGCGSQQRVAGSRTSHADHAAARPTYKVGAPHQISAVWYYPAVDYDYDETGLASWYGEPFDRQFTANGEVFDLNQLTAVHRTLPMPSVVQMTNLANGRSMQSRVNDRGPFTGDRIPDVARRAAQLLGFETKGTALVRVSIIKDESMRVAELAKRNGGDAGASVAEAASAAAVDAAAMTKRPSDVPAPLPPPAAAPVNAVPPPVPVAGCRLCLRKSLRSGSNRRNESSSKQARSGFGRTLNVSSRASRR
jgi:rare lipoprotein A